MSSEKQKELEDLVKDFIPIVAKIEHGMEITKDHYGRYMQLLSGAESKNMLVYILIKAGANSYGVSWAYKLITGN